MDVYLVIFEFCLQEARFVGQVSVSPGAFRRPATRLADRHAGWKPAVALLFAGGDGLTIGSPIDPILSGSA